MISKIHSIFRIRLLLLMLITSILNLFLITSCTSNEKNAAPVNKQTMGAILVDMYVAQAAAQFRMVTKDSLLFSHKSHYYPEIFEKYRIDEVTYQEAYTWYTKNPEEMHDVYDKVVETLTRLEAANHE